MHARSATFAIAALVALVAAVAVASLASAAGSVNSKLKLFEAGTVGNVYLSIGAVTSPEKDCLAARKVKFIVKRPGGKSEVVDVARTSDRGGWSSIIPEDDYNGGGVDGTLYKLSPRKIEKGGKKIKCEGAKVVPA